MARQKYLLLCLLLWVVGVICKERESSQRQPRLFKQLRKENLNVENGIPDGPFAREKYMADMRGKKWANRKSKDEEKVTVGGQIWYVNSGIANAGNGESWNGAFKSLQTAINAAGNGDQIWVAQGTYTPTSDGDDISSSFKITQNGLKLYGGFVGTETSIDNRQSPLPTTTLSGKIGTNLYCTHVMQLSGNHIILDGITVSDGYAQGTMDGENYCIDCFGGGIYILNPETTAAGGDSNSNDDDDNDNGNDNLKSIPSNENTYYYELSQVTLSNNKAIQGGGIFAYSYIDLTIDDCTFSNNEAFDGSNHAGGGGAIFISYHSTMTITNSQFSDNSGSTAGGAINIDYGVTATLTSCTFTSNVVSSGHGGAIYVTDRNSNSGDTTLIATDCQFTSNSATGYGGAIFLYYDSVGQLEGNTFTDNIAGYEGGALGLYNVECWGCCDNPGPNSFSGNTGSGGKYSENNCYIDEFDYIGKTSTDTDVTSWLETLWYQRDSSNEPTQKEYVAYVDGSKASSGDGWTWSTAVTTIQEAIDKALLNGPAQTEIWVKGGNTINYYPTEIPYWYNKTASYYDSQKSKMIYVRNFIHIYGGFAGGETQRDQRNWYLNPTTITGQLTTNVQAYQVVYMDTNSYIDGFIIRNGHSWEGGIMLSDNKKRIRFNEESGHPISDPYNTRDEHRWNDKNENGTVGRNSDQNNVLYSRDPNRGSGIFANATVTLSNLVIADNYAWKGGGLYVLDHTVTATNIALVKNYAEYRGGGVSVDSGGLYKCTNCIYYGNGCSRKGGGMYLDYACEAYNTNAYWERNYALDSGGALCIDGAGKAHVTSNTVYNNSAFMEGAAMYAGSYNPYSPRPNIWMMSGNNVIKANECTTGMGHANSFLWNYDYIDYSE